MNRPHFPLLEAAVGEPPSAGAPPGSPPAGSPPGAPAAPASGISEPWAKTWIQPDFTLDHKALDRLPDHLKSLRPTLERQKSFEDVLTVMSHQQVLAGKKALAPLPPDAPDPVKAERKTLLDTINGVPATPKDYGIARPQDLPAEQWNQPLADAFTSWAHKHSVSPDAAKELLAIQTNAVKGQLGEQQQYEQQFFAQQQQAFEAQIRQDNIPADRANSLAEAGARALGLDLQKPEHQALLKNASVKLMAMRHAIATGEDQTTDANQRGDNPNDPAKLAFDIARNPANPQYAVYWNREGKYSTDEQQAVVARVAELHRKASAMGGR